MSGFSYKYVDRLIERKINGERQINIEGGGVGLIVKWGMGDKIGKCRKNRNGVRDQQRLNQSLSQLLGHCAQQLLFQSVSDVFSQPVSKSYRQ